MKAVLYCRYSSDSQNENSIEGQLRENKQFAERKGMTILGTYIEACGIIEPTRKSPLNQGFRRVGQFFISHGADSAVC
jgi:DNA invertase Pin-like site-specific DNA recombinase